MSEQFSAKPFEPIVNTRLESVCFTSGHVTFVFQKATFAALMWPTITAEGRERRHSDAGYREALCSLMDKTLQSARAVEAVGISLFFEGAATLFVSLRPDERNPLGETAMLSHVPDVMWVW